MPPTIALFLTTAFVVLLVWRDCRERAQVTAALWIPVIWMLLTASRPLSFWLGFGGAIYDTPADLVEGSPLDRIVFIVLELAAFVVLFRRGISWSTVLSRNLWLTVFLAYCGVSIMWSDFPFAAFKRWIKVLGLPMMVLILATEPNPREAIVRLMKRSAYVLVPFSILLIKYYPHLGRAFDPWSGAASNTGVTSNKNELICLYAVGLFLFLASLGYTTARQDTTAPERAVAHRCFFLHDRVAPLHVQQRDFCGVPGSGDIGRAVFQRALSRRATNGCILGRRTSDL